LCYLEELNEAFKLPDFVPEVALERSISWSNFPVQKYSLFLKQHSFFWVYSTSNRNVEWLLPKLLREGKTIEWRGSIAEGALYRVH